MGTGLLLAQDMPPQYRTYCAGCHGARLEGGSATALVKTDWTYGRNRGAVVRNIKYGIAGTEMAAWQGVLADEDIEALADFILDAQRIPLTSVRPLPALLATEAYTLRVTPLVAEGIDTPWSMVFLDAQRALVSERPGQLRLIVDGELSAAPVADTPPTFAVGTGGYLGLALDPDYAANGWIYLALTHSLDNQAARDTPSLTKVVRGKIRGNTWYDSEVLFEAPASLLAVNGNRWGGRLFFDRDGYLYFTIGDMAMADDSQDPGKATGKIFRIHADGTVPSDNPFVTNADAIGAVFALGARNVQGLAQHPERGEIWFTDHGPMGGDELNILAAGANFGWPVVTYGVDYDGAVVSDKTVAAGMVAPVVQWTPSIAASSAAFVTGSNFPAWQHDLLIGALAFEEVRRLKLSGDKVVHQEVLLKGYGRVRDVLMGPDEQIYVLLNSPDMIIALAPVR